MRRKLIPGTTDLATTNPSLAAEWHPTKNGDLSASLVMAGSKKKAWWQCSGGHAWQAEIKSRVSGNGCPFCSGYFAIPGLTDLESKCPAIAKEWHPQKNNDLKSSDVTPFSNKKVWWLGKCGHEWEMRVEKRTREKQNCPYCSNHRVLEGFNDLATANPKLAEEWHPFKNAELLPTQVTKWSSAKVWWQCSNGHEWQAKIESRMRGCGCRECYKLKKRGNRNDKVEKKYFE